MGSEDVQVDRNDLLNDILDKLHEFARTHHIRLWVEVTNEEEHYFMFSRYGINNKCCEYMIVPEEVEDADSAVETICDDVRANLLSGNQTGYGIY